MLQLAAEKSVANLTVGEVARQAGVHRSTVYLHYSGLPELLDDCARELFRQLRDDLWAMNQTNPRWDGPQLSVYVTRVFRHLETHEAFYRAMLGRQGDPLFRVLFQEEIAQLLLEPIATEKMRNGKRPQFEMILRFFSAGFTEIATWWLEKGKPLSAENAATRIANDLLPDYVRLIYSQGENMK